VNAAGIRGRPAWSRYRRTFNPASLTRWKASGRPTGGKPRGSSGPGYCTVSQHLALTTASSISLRLLGPFAGSLLMLILDQSVVGPLHRIDHEQDDTIPRPRSGWLVRSGRRKRDFVPTGIRCRWRTPKACAANRKTGGGEDRPSVAREGFVPTGEIPTCIARYSGGEDGSRGRRRRGAA